MPNKKIIEFYFCQVFILFISIASGCIIATAQRVDAASALDPTCQVPKECKGKTEIEYLQNWLKATKCFSEDYIVKHFRNFREEYISNDGRIDVDQVVNASLDWNDVCEKLTKNGWAKQINSISIDLTVNPEKEKARMSKVFGNDFSKIFPILQWSLNSGKKRIHFEFIIDGNLVDSFSFAEFDVTPTNFTMSSYYGPLKQYQLNISKEDAYQLAKKDSFCTMCAQDHASNSVRLVVRDRFTNNGEDGYFEFDQAGLRWIMSSGCGHQCSIDALNKNLIKENATCV